MKYSGVLVLKRSRVLSTNMPVLGDLKQAITVTILYSAIVIFSPARNESQFFPIQIKFEIRFYSF